MTVSLRTGVCLTGRGRAHELRFIANWNVLMAFTWNWFGLSRPNCPQPLEVVQERSQWEKFLTSPKYLEATRAFVALPSEKTASSTIFRLFITAIPCQRKGRSFSMILGGTFSKWRPQPVFREALLSSTMLRPSAISRCSRFFASANSTRTAGSGPEPSGRGGWKSRPSRPPSEAARLRRMVLFFLPRLAGTML